MWHFSKLDRKLGYGDGRLIVAGESLSVEGPIIPCERGLHASERLIDALKYAPGPYLWEVELSGTAVHSGDKSAASTRKALRGMDMSDVLQEFARKVVLDSLQTHWDVKYGTLPDVLLEWLRTGDESLRSAAAAAAADAAARAARAAANAADAAARAAAYAAVYAARAAVYAARAAADAAAYAAADAAARTAAAYAARAAVYAARAVVYAARAAADAAARAAADTSLLETMVLDAFAKAGH